MINKIKNKFKSDDNKRLFSNFISLAFLQGANYILPLVTLPYLVRVLGIEYFGLLAFAMAVINYFKIITDYGFNLTATRDISTHRDNKDKIIEIFNSVMIIKFFLMILSFLLLTCLIFFFDRFAQHWEIYYLTFGIVIGQVLFPVWFFQGMEQMKYITYLNILAKVIFTIAIFIFVQEKNDFWIVPLLTSVGFIVSGVFGLIIVKKRFDIYFKKQKLEVIKRYLYDGWHVFQQQFYVSMYGTINILFLGFFTDSTIVGYYSIVEKIMLIPSALFTVATQAYYPYAVRIFRKSIKEYFVKLKMVSILFIVLSFILTVFIFGFSSELVSLITGKEINIEIIDILHIIVLGIIFSSFGSLFTQVFVTLNKAKILNTISLIVMILNMVFAPIIIISFGVVGLASFVLFRQFLVIASSVYYIEKFKNKLIKE